MKQFEVVIIPAMNGMFTVVVSRLDSSTGNTTDFEFCGSVPEVGDFIRTVTTQELG